MTKEEILAKWDAMTPRERDAWVARDVMGWHLPKIEMDYITIPAKLTQDGIQQQLKITHIPLTPKGELAEIPHYSTSIMAAWEVVEKMQCDYGLNMALYNKAENPDKAGEWGWLCYFANHPKHGQAWAKTAPHAISIAALLAGVEHGQG